MKTDNTQNKKDITNLKTNVYTKTESDEKYVPARNDFNDFNILSIVSNINGEFKVENHYTGVSAPGKVCELFVNNSSIGMMCRNYGIIIQDDEHGPQMVINDDFHRLLIDTDLPTAISTSDLNAILV